MAEGRVPRPIRLGLSAVAWVEQEISDYIARHIAESRVTLSAKPRKRLGNNTGSKPDAGLPAEAVATLGESKTLTVRR
jgi:hypothetical protein